MLNRAHLVVQVVLGERRLVLGQLDGLDHVDVAEQVLQDRVVGQLRPILRVSFGCNLRIKLKKGRI
jgi:hypothetical protein